VQQPPTPAATPTEIHLSGLHAGNRAFIEDLYARWLDSPSAVSPAWQDFFAGYEGRGPRSSADVVDPPPVRRSIFGGAAAGGVADQAEHARKNAAVVQLISAWRRNGHMVARLDPLGLKPRRRLAQLELAYHGLSEADLDTLFHVGRLAGPKVATLREIQERCERTYGGSIGAEFMYIRDEDRRHWVERRIEEAAGRYPLQRKQALRVLDKLVAADRFEDFVHTKYIGAKRFSVEGGEALIPLLDGLVQCSAGLGVKELAFGMAHRGRLNVLANILGKAHADIFEEFEDKGERPDARFSGDVKYHLGWSCDVPTETGGLVHLSLAFNPSHLEFVNPVVAGQVRGKQDHFGDLEHRLALPVLIHGDAAFIGQGVVAETVNMSRLPGYETGGTVHIAINNQVGFTTPPESSRSSEHCTDIVKVVLPPVLHVNADDLGAVAFVARLAAEYRQTFRDDIVIDLVCYRRYGHNEGDEPGFTNPLMVDAIRKRQAPLQHYFLAMERAGILQREDLDKSLERTRAHLESELVRARQQARTGELSGLWKGMTAGEGVGQGEPPTIVGEADLRAFALALSRAPEDFAVHPKVRRILDGRREMAEASLPLDWALAEHLAFASLLAEGFPVRLSGQDAGRGTFSHRHAVLHEQKTGATHVPLQHLGREQATFEVYDSPLSEAAVLGFEYGYTLVRPQSLVIWEAQFGDFANGAQVLIDQFVCSGEAKWNRCSGLVMLLPHGYEGQGPEHSSARLERFLQLSGDDNWRVVYPTTPAQIFHVLRSQLHRRFRKPLVVMSPKSLLRHPAVASSWKDLSAGAFRTVIPDEGATPGLARRVVFCSGKVYYDLLAARRAAGRTDVALVRVEQLFPFPGAEIRAELDRLPGALPLWCQEEPRNMGAWAFISEAFRDELGLTLDYAGRPRSAAPATGSKHLHDHEQRALVAQALGPA
jgi:2-oxoglutarate dehydrogenase E1 component